MHLTQAQADLIDELHRFTNVIEPFSKQSKVDCADFMLRVLDQFGSLAIYHQGIHEHNGAYVRQFDGIARTRLFLSLSFEHPGLDKILDAFMEDLGAEHSTLATTCSDDKYLASTDPEDLPILVGQDLKIPHRLEILSWIFPTWVNQEIDRYFQEAATGDQRFLQFQRWMTKAVRPNSLELLTTAHRNMVRAFCRLGVEKTMVAVHAVDCPLTDRRRCSILGAVPTAGECLKRLDNVLAFFTSRKYLDLASEASVEAASAAVSVYAEIVHACGDVSPNLLGQHLMTVIRKQIVRFSVEAEEHLTEFQTAVAQQLATTLRGVTQQEIHKALDPLPNAGPNVIDFLYFKYQPLHRLLENLGLSPAILLANALTSPGDPGIKSETDALVMLITTMPSLNGQVDAAMLWTYGILRIAGVDRLLELPLPDADRFKLYLAFDDKRLRDIIVDDCVLESVLVHELGL
ncbi:hypothetical protein DV532_26585 (plasmid) [Pseudomonas sp. Leaf58]|uniref:hypothetical protein n=1 Tax=Pseudomonas sp. Leaf58 TaxID=1736226 RepID=UPI0006F4F440|nr:hypothetical protein [Pseudomonas sp. Leaf58]AYG47854.1 hypothetical protein DV532_26585 [Pseudomonas sp. Leaf58]KQN62581.1 hypothetical protein ASF02_10570 [Pseudomonas sp. Leaf58]